MLKSKKKLKKGNTIVMIPSRMIYSNPHQIRKSFNWNEIEGLAHSIQTLGLLEPIIVRQLQNGNYELVFGERRLRACKMAGLTSVPSIIVGISEEKSAFLATAENIQRKNLNFFEEALAVEYLIKGYKYSREEVSCRLGLTTEELEYKLKILRLPEKIRTLIVSNQLTEDYARALLRLPSILMMEQMIDAIIEKNLTASETDNAIAETLNQMQENKKKGKTVMIFKDIQIFINTLNHAVSTMKNSGINATSIQEETESYIEYTVRIEKNVIAS